MGWDGFSDQKEVPLTEVPSVVSDTWRPVPTVRFRVNGSKEITGTRKKIFNDSRSRPLPLPLLRVKHESLYSQRVCSSRRSQFRG